MLRLFVLAALVLTVAACDTTTETATLGVREGEVSADGGAVRYLSLTVGGGTIPDSAFVAPAAADTSIAWEIGFRGTEVVLNSGASGPGATVAAFVETPFAEVDTIGVTGLTYRRDGESVCEDGERRAVCSAPGSAFSPYTLDADGAVVADPSRTLVLRTGDARGYAKVQFLDYAPADPADPESGGTVTIRFLANPVGRLLVDGLEVSP